MTDLTDTDPEEYSLRENLLLKLARARAAVQTVTKTEEADLGTYVITYANIGSVMVVVDEAMRAEGLDWVHVSDVTSPDRWTLDTLVIDTDTGFDLQFSGPPGTIKSDPQAMGGMITYYRRYALVMLMGLNVEDDDAAQAQRAHNHETSGTARTPAESEVIRLIKLLPSKEARDQIKADFRTEFGCGMSELSESKHGDGLTFVKGWVAENVPAEAKS